ncbi:MAG: alpha/beta fold hydrolase [Oscillospiraceae bacterium]|nr:alpha/beta fold hydrolase [Oscillospiraceae bacterium]
MVLCVVLLVLLVTAVGLCYGAARFTYLSSLPHEERPYAIPPEEQYQACKGRMLSLIKEIDEIPFEPVTIRSHDGLTLFGRYYHVRSGAPLQIQMHGYRGSALRDFCGGNKLARESGYNTLLIDERGHGRSGGTVISFGVKERLDCQSWARYAAERFGPETPIILCGVSMGAATVLMASDLDLPETVKAIVADCPFSSPHTIIREVCWGMPKAFRILYPFATLSAKLFGHFDLDGASALQSVARTKLPILLIHGEDDRFVPCAMSRQIAAACASPVRLETFPEAGHGLSYIVDPVRYGQVVRDFLEGLGLGAE